MRIPFHMCTEDAVSFIDRVKPEMAIFIHLGIVMIKSGAEKQAFGVRERTGIKTIAAKDLDVLDVGSALSVLSAETFDDEWIPNSSP
jgi:phosphoribosyl 1,2-cyclic phosphodiesterase